MDSLSEFFAKHESLLPNAIALPMARGELFSDRSLTNRRLACKGVIVILSQGSLASHPIFKESLVNFALNLGPNYQWTAEQMKIYMEWERKNNKRLHQFEMEEAIVEGLSERIMRVPVERLLLGAARILGEKGYHEYLRNFRRTSPVVEYCKRAVAHMKPFAESEEVVLRAQ